MVKRGNRQMSEELQVETLDLGTEILAESGGVTVELITEATEAKRHLEVRPQASLELSGEQDPVTPRPDLAVYMSDTSFDVEIADARVTLIAPVTADPATKAQAPKLSRHALTAYTSELAVTRRAA
jgi:hypothetical protein